MCDCVKNTGKFSDNLEQTRIDAQELSKKEGINVAIVKTGEGYRYQCYKGEHPDGTVEVIIPGE